MTRLLVFAVAIVALVSQEAPQERTLTGSLRTGSAASVCLLRGAAADQNAETPSGTVWSTGLQNPGVSNGNGVLAQSPNICTSNSSGTYMGLVAFVQNGNATVDVDWTVSFEPVG